jgi:hypothetical protein
MEAMRCDRTEEYRFNTASKHRERRNKEEEGNEKSTWKKLSSQNRSPETRRNFVEGFDEKKSFPFLSFPLLFFAAFCVLLRVFALR